MILEAASQAQISVLLLAFIFCSLLMDTKWVTTGCRVSNYLNKPPGLNCQSCSIFPFKYNVYNVHTSHRPRGKGGSLTFASLKEFFPKWKIKQKCKWFTTTVRSQCRDPWGATDLLMGAFWKAEHFLQPDREEKVRFQAWEGFDVPLGSQWGKEPNMSRIVGSLWLMRAAPFGDQQGNRNLSPIALSGWISHLQKEFGSRCFSRALRQLSLMDILTSALWISQQRTQARCTFDL